MRHSLEELVGHYSVSADGLCCQLHGCLPEVWNLKDEWEFMKNGILLDYLQKGEGQLMKLPELIDIAAQVASTLRHSTSFIETWPPKTYW